MNTYQRAVLAHVVIDPDAWYAHVVSEFGQGKGDETLGSKVARWESEYLAQKDRPGYQTRAQREAPR